MSASLAKRTRAAATAGWWTLLIAAIWLTLGWLTSLALLSARPKWLLTLWGGGELTWTTVHTITLGAMAAFKMILLVALLLVIWLTLWSCRLKRAEEADK